MNDFTGELCLFDEIIVYFVNFDIILGMFSSYVICLLGLKLDKCFSFGRSDHLDWNSSC